MPFVFFNVCYDYSMRWIKNLSGRKKIFLILSVMWMAVIFAMSSRTGNESTQDSTYIGRMVGTVVVPGFEEMSESQQEDYALAIDHIVRKSAHAAEYGLLGLLLLGIFYDGSVRNCIVAWLLTSAYAASDEFHQLFVPGRSGQVSDIVIDSTGALITVLVVAFWVMYNNRTRDDEKERGA